MPATECSAKVVPRGPCLHGTAARRAKVGEDVPPLCRRSGGGTILCVAARAGPGEGRFGCGGAVRRALGPARCRLGGLWYDR